MLMPPSFASQPQMPSPSHKPYRGRFAPTPSGPLHFGSLVAAVGSYLDARARNGQWLLRVEDIDPPRELKGAADDILRTLEAHGFEWDEEVVYQSRRNAAYADALARLDVAGLTYGCACTRKEIADSATRGIEGLVYPGTCRNGLATGRTPRAWRIRVPDGSIQFDDRIQGPVSQQLGSEIGDFILKRADGLYSYQLAVVVDDADAGITDIVRGADLKLSTPRQIYLQHCLGVPTPSYAHLPLALNRQGDKLSKQNLAKPLDAARAAASLADALRFLGMQPPLDANLADLPSLWQWAIANWDIRQVPTGDTASKPDYDDATQARAI